VVVDNRPGGFTVIGADLVAKAAPDGYTLFLMPGTHVLTPLMVQSTPYNPIADFTPIAYLGAQPYYLYANAQQPYATFAEMVAYGKANPGGITMGVSDSVTLVIANAFKTAAKLDITIVPYKGGGPQNADFIGNQISMAVGTPNMMQFVTSGKARALSATTPSRVPFTPQIPTIAELVPGSNFNVTARGRRPPARGDPQGNGRPPDAQATRRPGRREAGGYVARGAGRRDEGLPGPHDDTDQGGRDQARVTQFTSLTGGATEDD
jgi:tripartite-type tricarboxylate transporter receptor subunit TctC